MNSIVTECVVLQFNNLQNSAIIRFCYKTKLKYYFKFSHYFMRDDYPQKQP